MNLKLVLFFSFAILMQSLIAQNGIIRGKIIDAESAEPMFAASAGIEGTTDGASSDFDGNFEISIAPGKYNLVISFIGYKSTTISNVEVFDSEVTFLGSIALENSAINVETVVISAEAIKNSEVAILTIKKKSVNVIDGISSENFKKIGDSDAAVAVKRVPGVSVQGGKYVYVRGLGDRYTKTTLNELEIPGLDPDRNSIQLDIFPTSIIDNIIVR